MTDPARNDPLDDISEPDAADLEEIEAHPIELVTPEELEELANGPLD